MKTLCVDKYQNYVEGVRLYFIRIPMMPFTTIIVIKTLLYNYDSGYSRHYSLNSELTQRGSPRNQKIPLNRPKLLQNVIVMCYNNITSYTEAVWKMSSIVHQHDKRIGVTYAYESTSYWDKEKKQSRAKRKLIGIVDPETGEIKPTSKKKRGSAKPAEMPNPTACPHGFRKRFAGQHQAVHPRGRGFHHQTQSAEGKPDRVAVRRQDARRADKALGWKNRLHRKTIPR